LVLKMWVEAMEIHTTVVLARGGLQYYPASIASGSYDVNAPQGGSQSESKSYGTMHYGGLSQGGSQYYHGSNACGSLEPHRGSYYGGSSGFSCYENLPVPPPTFGGPFSNNYGQRGALDDHGDIYGGGPYLGIYGSTSTFYQSKPKKLGLMT